MEYVFYKKKGRLLIFRDPKFKYGSQTTSPLQPSYASLLGGKNETNLVHIPPNPIRTRVLIHLFTIIDIKYKMLSASITTIATIFLAEAEAEAN
jgi:hypothetical protein